MCPRGIVAGTGATAIALQKEALHALLNLASWGPAHLAAVVGAANMVPGVLSAVQLGADREIKHRALQMVELICRALPTGAAEVERCGGVAVLSGQQFSTIRGLPAAATELLQRYFARTTHNDD